MFIIFILLFTLLGYLIIEAADDVLMCRKFKEGYMFDTYKLIFHTTETYIMVHSYRIIERRNKYILVQDVTKDEFEEFDIIKLLHNVDKIIIKDNNGKEFKTFYKLDQYQESI